jgi:prepilin-type N-terminal cleavage/methylation domain-containing protein
MQEQGDHIYTLLRPRIRGRPGGDLVRRDGDHYCAWAAPRGGSKHTRPRRGLTLIELMVVIAIIAILGVILYPVFALARESARKATCMSNLKQITFAVIMYAQDYDEVLPIACATGFQSTSHAIEPVNNQITVVAALAAGLGSADYWQLPDVLRPYVKSIDIFQCPTLCRRYPPFLIEQRALTSGPAEGQLKVGNFHMSPPNNWEWSGSYFWSCLHYPYGAGVDPADYSTYVGAIWDVAVSLGYVSDTDDPARYWVCGNAIGTFDNPVGKMMVSCDSYGDHEGYSDEYAMLHAIPPELGGTAPTIGVAVPAAFVDGHVKYVRVNFYEMLGILSGPNEIR